MMLNDVQIKLITSWKEQNNYRLLKVTPSPRHLNLVDSLYNSVEQQLGIEKQKFVLLSKNGIKIQSQKSSLTDGQVIQICPTVLGGKGGFGSLLRAFGKQMQQSTNKEACRDLTGRRIRHINNEKKLKEFIDKQEEIAAEKEQKKAEKAKRRKEKYESMEHSHHLFVDPKYDQQKEKISNDLEEAINKACSEKQKEKKKNEPKTSGNTEKDGDSDNDTNNDNGDDSNSSGDKSNKNASELATSDSKATTSKDQATTSKTKDSNSNSNSNSKVKEQEREKSKSADIYGDWMGCGDLDVSSSTSDDDSDGQESQPVKKKLKN